MINKRVANIIALIVASVWALSFILSALPNSTYRTDPQVHTVMLVIAGAAVAAGMKGDK